MLSKYFRTGYPLLCWQRTTREKRPIFCLPSLQTYGGMRQKAVTDGKVKNITEFIHS